MSDEQNWRTPGAARPEPAASPWATPGAEAPSASQPTGGQDQPPPAWTPPPKPGLIPLHPLSFGTIMGSSFQVMRRNPAPTFGLSVLLYGFITIGYLVLFGLFFAFASTRISTATDSDQYDIMAGTIGLFMLFLFIPLALGIVAGGILQGILSLEVSRATLGEKLKIRGLWHLAKGRFGALILWALLVTGVLIVFVVVASLIMVAITAVLALGSTSTSPGGAIVLGFLLILVMFVVAAGFVVLSVWLGTKTSLVPSVIVLERLGLLASIARSWSLTRNNFWRTFGIQILIAVMINIATSIITFPVQIIGTVLVSLINPMQEDSTAIVGIVVLTIVTSMLTVVVGAIGLVMQSSSLAFIYIDIRMRKEGLDLELMQYVESKGKATGVENPYLRLQRAPSATPAQPAAGSPWA